MDKNLSRLVAGWATLIFLGYCCLLVYAGTPGEAAATPAAWSKGGAISFRQGRPNLVMFLHPRCSCSRASLAELDRLMTTLNGKIYLHVVFVRPPGKNDEWVKDSNWERARELPGEPELEILDAKRLASSFAAKTSGQILFYSESGALVFSGGITPARGHMGDSAGRAAILSYVFSRHENLQTAESKVFGCSLASKTSETE